MTATAQQQIRGLPPTRAYPLEEIGTTTRSATLGFDPFGRVAVVGDGSYSVLNDSQWVDLMDDNGGHRSSVATSVTAADGRMYFAGLGSWGSAALEGGGRLRTSPIVDPAAPDWTRLTAFSGLLAGDDGVWVSGWNGVIHFDPNSRHCTYFPLVSIAAMFRSAGRIYVSSHRYGLHRLDLKTATAEALPNPGFGGHSVFAAAEMADGRTLLVLTSGEVRLFDGQKSEAWAPQIQHGLTGRVTAVLALDDGVVALAINGRGLFLIAPDGSILSSLVSPQYHRITRLASREKGVLWAITETAVEKILYGSPVTEFGQRLGLPLSWPLVAPWRGTLAVATEGRLFTAAHDQEFGVSQFEVLSQQPRGGAWSLIEYNGELLIGNATGLYSLSSPESEYKTVVAGLSISHLVAPRPGLCFAIGTTEIAALGHVDGRWVEVAPRLKVDGAPAIAQAGATSGWLEYGANKVGRVFLREGQIRLQMLSDSRLARAPWTNVGLVGGKAVLTGDGVGRAYYDEATGEPCEAPALEALIERAPYPVVRMYEDTAGSVWATHRRGLIKFSRQGNEWKMDASSFDHFTDPYPRVQIVGENDIWLYGARSLFHLTPKPGAPVAQPLTPRLISVWDVHANRDFIAASGVSSAYPPTVGNSLRVQVFSGTYTWFRAPSFQFRVSPTAPWSPLASGAPIELSELREGRYTLEVRVADRTSDNSGAIRFDFEVQPPWYRTYGAFVGYAVAVLFGFAALSRWLSARSRRRNEELEKLVKVRTQELEQTMERLNDETRVAATLAERNRVAGEIHDSLQQGLCGAILQIDATLAGRPERGPLEKRLETIRNMISYTRHEVQNAIWDLESPVLAGADLWTALNKLISLLNPGTLRVNLDLEGTPYSLASNLQHHLLRMCQEAVTNAIRHSSATGIAIHLRFESDTLSLSISDDGVGFDMENVLTHHPGHFGLRGMQERARKIGARLQVTSAPGAGTTLEIHLPRSPSDASP